MTGPYDWLNGKVRNTYSQFGEDGVLAAIFQAIGVENSWCFECGAADGLFFSNTRRLIEGGWSALLVEADPEAFTRLQANNAAFAGRVTCVNARVDDANRLEDLLTACGAPRHLDLAVIDVDGQDYYLWNSMLRYRPRVVVIEFDHTAPVEFIPTAGGPGQAGWAAISRLGAGKFYDLVHHGYCNMIFVRHPLAGMIAEAGRAHA
jgi:hypothetical protein